MYPVHIALVLVCGLVLLACIVLLVLTRGLSEKYALLWLALALGVLGSPFIYGVFSMLHLNYGWPTATAMLFFCGFFLVLALLLQLSLAISHGRRERKRLAQRLALLEEEVATCRQAFIRQEQAAEVGDYEPGQAKGQK